MGIIVSNERLERCRDLSVYRDDGSCSSMRHFEVIEGREEVPFDENLYIDVGFDISKAREDEGLVSGWANVAINKDGSIPLDWQDDIIEPSVLEKAAINFMLEYRGSGEMHKGDSKGTVVESIVFTKEKQQALGIPDGVVPEGWFITVKIDDPEVFEKVKDGTYRMFSIQGTAKRVKL